MYGFASWGGISLGATFLLRNPASALSGVVLTFAAAFELPSTEPKVMLQLSCVYASSGKTACFNGLTFKPADDKSKDKDKDKDKEKKNKDKNEEEERNRRSENGKNGNESGKNNKDEEEETKRPCEIGATTCIVSSRTQFVYLLPAWEVVLLDAVVV